MLVGQANVPNARGGIVLINDPAAVQQALAVHGGKKATSTHPLSPSRPSSTFRSNIFTRHLAPSGPRFRTRILWSTFGASRSHLSFILDMRGLRGPIGRASTSPSSTPSRGSSRRSSLSSVRLFSPFLLRPLRQVVDTKDVTTIGTTCVR